MKTRFSFLLILFVLVLNINSFSQNSSSAPKASCDPISSLPFVENFDTWGTGSNAFPACWTRPVMYSAYPSCRTQYPVSPPSTLFFQSLTTTPTYAITPGFAEDIHNLMVSFSLKAESIYHSGKIHVGVMSNPSDTNTFELVQIISPTTTNHTAYEVLFNTTVLTGSNKYIAFRHVSNANNWYYWMDDVVVEVIPTCRKPKAIASSAVTGTTANISWTAGESETAWNIIVSPTVITDFTSVISVPVTATSYSATGLIQGTKHYVYVQANCGIEDESVWVSSSFTTLITCPAPTGISIADIAKSSATISWIAGASETNWNIIVSETAITDFSSVTPIDLSTSSYSATGLSPETTYHVYVQANCGVGDVSYWISSSFTTPESCPAPTNMIIADITSSSADISWTLGNIESAWNVIVSETEITDFSSVTPVEVTTIPYSAASLTPETLYYTYVQANCGISDASLWINSSFNTQAICPVPTNVAITNVSSSAATISWTLGNIETAWNLIISETAITDFSSVTPIEVTANPYLATGLTSETTYYVYVQADCGGEDISVWTAQSTFNTPCVEITSFPWTENFENIVVPNLPLCWSQINNNADPDFWKTFSNNGVGGSKSVGIYTDGNYGNNDDYLILPGFVLTGNERLYYSVRAYSASEPNDYRVVLSTTGKNPSDFTEVLRAKSTVNWTTMEEIDPIDMSAYSGNVYIAIHIPSGGLDGWFIYFDDFKIETIPSCIESISLVADNITTTSARLDWTEQGSADQWNIKISNTPINPETEDGVYNISTSEKPYTTPENLTPSSIYYFYVQPDCGGGDLAAWSSPEPFSTLCNIISSYPWMEDFEGQAITNLPTCWSHIDGNTDGDFWQIKNNYGVGNSKSVSLYTDYNGGNNDDYLILPQFALTGNEQFSYSVRSHSDNELNDYRVVLSTTGNDPADFTEVLIPLTVVERTTMTEIGPIDLSAYSGNVYIAVHVPSGGLDGWFIHCDNFKMETIPLCPQPLFLSADNITSTSARLNWTQYALASSWNVKISLAPINPETEEGIYFASTTNNPFTVPVELTPNTTYYYYVQAACDENEFSDWSSKGTFHTLCNGVSVPFAENFDTWGTGSNAFPSCWTRPNPFIYSSAVFPSCGSGGFVSSPSSLKFQSISTRHTYAVTPAFAEDIQDLMVSFSLKQSSLNSGKMEIGVMSNPNDTSTFELVQTIILTTIENTPYEIFLNATTLSGTNNHIAFRFISQNSSYAYSLDDVIVDLIPSCLWPTAVTSSAVKSSTATISWTARPTAPASGYEYYVSTSATPVPNGSTIASGSTEAGVTSADLSSLNSETQYYFWVRSNCGGEEKSPWTPLVKTFKTECSSYATFPFIEEFENGVPPACWREFRTPVSNYGWATHTAGVSGKCARFNSSSNATNNKSTLFSPTFDITSLSDPILQFDYKNPTGGDFTVRLSTDGGETYSNVLATGLRNKPEWTAFTYDLSAFIGSEVKIALVGTSNWGFSTANVDVDNFSIREKPIIDQIDLNSEVVNVNVCIGDSEETAKAALAQQITITDLNAEQYVVDLTWTIASYDANTPGNYNATGAFVLPAGVLQSNPVTPLVVTSLVTVNALPIPATFNFATEYCLGSTPEALPAMATNGFVGTWAPTAIATGIAGNVGYVFTPNAGQCAVETTVEVEIIALPVVTCSADFEVANINPVTLTATPVGGTYSGVGVTGNTFSADGLANDDYTITYNYTDGTTTCSNSCEFVITTNIPYPAIAEIDINNVVQNIAVCQGTSKAAAIALLPNQIVIANTENDEFTVDLNWTMVSYNANIPAVYSAIGTFLLPATVSQTVPSTPLQVTANVTVTANTIPTFSFATAYCIGTTPDLLPSTSDNGISGTWTPATISTIGIGIVNYVFTPDGAICANPITIPVTVSSPVHATFNFATIYCQGATAALPLTSVNGISGTWLPNAINTTSAGTSVYVFTPTVGQCGLETSVSLTIKAPVETIFSFETEYCLGTAPEALPATSVNGFVGTWIPATITTNTAGTFEYVFTPNDSECALEATVEVEIIALPVLTCQDDFEVTNTDPVALTASPMGGTYSGSAITGNTFSAEGLANDDYTITYNYTDGTTTCSNSCEFVITVIVPYPAIAEIDVNNVVENVTVCQGVELADAIALLVSQIVISNTEDDEFTVDLDWTITDYDANIPAVYNAIGTFELPATVSQTDSSTALQVTATITSIANTIPEFVFATEYCVGATPETLPLISENSVSGTWGPEEIVTTTAGSTDYVFTPDGAICASPVTISVTIDPIITPEFDFITVYCLGATAETLPLISGNSVSGTWLPEVINTTSAGNMDYVFTPDGAICSSPITITVTVNAPIEATFGFATEYCMGATPDVLPTISDVNAITGTWAPAIIATNTAGTSEYVFTPSDGECALETTIEVEIIALPVVSCQTDFEVTNSDPVTLTASPTGGTYTGTAITGNTFSANGLANDDYTITYNYADGTTGCANFCEFVITTNIPYPAIADIDVNNDVENLTVCQGVELADAIALLVSQIVITNTEDDEFTVDLDWTITDYDANIPAVYNAIGTFELPVTVSQTDPAAILEVTATVTVTENELPIFIFETEYCLGATPAELPLTSENSVSGTWEPEEIVTTTAGSTDYVFTPDGVICATPVTISVTVNAPVEATFSFATEYCIGATPDVLPTTSEENVTGTWGPAVIDTDISGEVNYVFTPNANQCGLETTILVTVNELTEATFNIETEYCLGATPAELPSSSTNNITGTWSPATISAAAAGIITYIFTPTAGQCANVLYVDVVVNALPEVTCPADFAVTEDGVVTLSGGLPAGGTYSGVSVTGNSFNPSALANGEYVVTYTYIADTECSNSCEFTITVDIVSSITVNQTAEIGIYPNPNRGVFNISFNNINGKANYQIYDTKGGIIVNKNIHTNGNTIEDVAINPVPGVYFVKVITTNKTYVEKLVIQ